MTFIELKENYNYNYSRKSKNILKLINIFVLLFVLLTIYYYFLDEFY